MGRSAPKVWAWGSWLHYPLSVIAWTEESWPLCPSMPEAVGKLALWSYGWQSCPWHPPAATLRGAGPVPCQDSTVKSTLLAELWESQLWNCDHGRAVPLPIVVWWHGQGDIALAQFISTGSRWENGLCGHKSERSIPDPYLLKQSGERATAKAVSRVGCHLARAAQWSQHCQGGCRWLSPEFVKMEELYSFSIWQTNPSAAQVQTQNYDLACPNIHPISDPPPSSGTCDLTQRFKAVGSPQHRVAAGSPQIILVRGPATKV